MSKMLIALGGNQRSVAGSSLNTLIRAIDMLESLGGKIRNVSAFYSTPCFPAGAGPDYVNAALLCSPPWDANQTLAQLHVIEEKLGRQRLQRWGQRTVDLDLIAREDLIAPDLETFEKWRDLALDSQKTMAPQELILPHPRLQDRAFVLRPLLDVAPDWVHPVSGLNVQQMLDALPEAEKAAVVALKP